MVTEENSTMTAAEVVMESRELQVHYGDYLAVRGVDLQIHSNEINALIGPSGL